MIHLQFMGETAELEKGIEQIASSFGIAMGEGGIVVTVERKQNGLSVSGGNGTYQIAYGEKVDFFRALRLLCSSLQQESVQINETRNIQSSGVMIDCSRNGVLKPETIRDILRRMAGMGLNMVMLYTEDTYEIDGYPYFGYMRGKYTKEELKALDAYAAALGVELVPCIQTLGHMEMALRWPAFDNVKGTDKVLLVDEPETYRLIEAMLKSCRECFSTEKIHIGMDEAFGTELGRFLEKNGYQHKYDVISRHLFKVAELVKDYGFKPMIWSDMFYTAASPTWNYLDINAVIPEDMPGKIPENVSIVYYDYETDSIDRARTYIQKHNQMGRKVIYGGALWRWVGMGMNYNKIFRITHSALKACRKEGITDVFATVWGDDGTVVDIYSILLGMQLYAEYIYYDEVSDEHLRERFKMCTGYDMESFLALDFDDYPEEWCHPRGFGGCIWDEALCISKQVLFQDLLLGLLDKNFEGLDLAGHYRQRLENLNKVNVPQGLEEMFDYYKQLLEVISQKSHMGLRISAAYQGGDKAELKLVIDDLKVLYRETQSLHTKFSVLWHKNNKAFGYERMDLRYGGLLARIKTAEQKLEGYMNGSISVIEELEEPRLMYGGENVKPGKSLVMQYKYDRFAIPGV